MMPSSQTSADASDPVRPLQISVEILANLIYPARRPETHSEGPIPRLGGQSY
jgi:hypothetical protein